MVRFHTRYLDDTLATARVRALRGCGQAVAGTRLSVLCSVTAHVDSLHYTIPQCWTPQPHTPGTNARSYLTLVPKDMMAALSYPHRPASLPGGAPTNQAILAIAHLPSHKNPHPRAQEIR
jgi:hypothetical protein